MKKAYFLILVIGLALSGVVSFWPADNVAAAGGVNEYGGENEPAGPHALNMTFRGQVGGSTAAVTVSGDLVVGAVGPRLMTWQYDDTSITSLGASQPLPANIESVIVADNIAAVAAGEFGVYLFDLSDAANPLFRGAYDTDVYAFNLTVDEQTLYVADFAGGVLILDISNPATPVPLGNISVSPALAVRVVDDVAYVALGNGGLGVAALSDSGVPVETDVLPFTTFTLDVAGDLLFAAGTMSGGLYILDISTPTAPTSLAYYATDEYVHGVHLIDNHAYVRVGYQGIYILDVSVTAAPTLVTFFATADAPIELALTGDDHAFVAVQGAGLQLLDVTSAAAPLALAAWQTSGITRDLTVAGGVAFVAAEQGGLRLLSLNEEADELGSLSFDETIVGVAQAGGYAYLTAAEAGLFVVDVSDPVQPVLVDQLAVDGFAWRAVVAGNHLYITARSGGLHIFDISDPAAPLYLSTYQSWNDTQAVAVVDDVAYIADYTGLQIVDVSDPAQPSLLGSIMTDGYAADVAVAGGHAYVADFDGVAVIDVTAPAQPQAVAFFDTPGAALGVTVAGQNLYVAAGQEGVRVLHLTTATTSLTMGYYDTPGMAESVAVVGSQVFVADQFGGLDIIDYTGTVYTTALPVVVRS